MIEQRLSLKVVPQFKEHISAYWEWMPTLHWSKDQEILEDPSKRATKIWPLIFPFVWCLYHRISHPDQLFWDYIFISFGIHPTRFIWLVWLNHVVQACLSILQQNIWTVVDQVLYWSYHPRCSLKQWQSLGLGSLHWHRIPQMNGASGNARLLLSMTQQARYCQHERKISKRLFQLSI